MIIIYDFDGTLTPYSVPQYKIIEECGYTIEQFMKKVFDRLEVKQENLCIAYFSELFTMMQEKQKELKNKNFVLGADCLTYNPGVEEFLKQRKQEGNKQYVISSGMKVYLENTKIAQYMDNIFGVTFCYENENVTGFDLILDNDKKVTIIKEILKNNPQINNREVIYIGDGLTDQKAFEYMKKIGGTAIFVYHTEKDQEVYQNLKDKQKVDYGFKANFLPQEKLNQEILKIKNSLTTVDK